MSIHGDLAGGRWASGAPIPVKKLMDKFTGRQQWLTCASAKRLRFICL
jgi:hypothetical protein